MSQTQAAPQLTGKMFLFERPELLNTQQHAGLGIKQASKPFGFCAKTRAVPLTISEIPEASKHYPIVFAALDDPLPIAIVGINEDVNLFVDADGVWDPLTYVPGYIRRYPFGLAGETGTDRYALVIDAAFEGVSPNADAKLFSDGQLSQLSMQAMEFTKTYEGDRQLTEQIFKKVASLGLIAGQTAQYTPPGSGDASPIAQYFGVDEKKLAEMSDAEFLELRKLGVLPVLYAHLMSLANWRHVISRRMRRFGMSEREAATGQRLA